MKRFGLFVASVVAAAGLSISANASSVITNGTVTLGVDNLGQLNIPGPASPTGTTIVGLRHNLTGNEATAHGCLCEGWGVGVGETPAVKARADNSLAILNLTPFSFISDGVTATSIADMTSGELRITHVFTPSASSNLYSVLVTIENTSGADIADLRYTRGMDWDIEPTQFNEFATIQGSAAATAVLFASASEPYGDPDPFAGRFGLTGDFIDNDGGSGFDTGAMFDFGFGELLAGESFSFEIFYGAAATEALALTALGAVLAEVYSFGQANCGGVPCDETFIFGFKGVGGVPIDPVPLPGAALFLLSALGALGVFGARRKKAIV